MARADVLDLVHDPAALAADAPAADVEQLDRRFEGVLGDADHVGVGAVGQHDRVLLHRSFQRPDVVTDPGRLLVLLVA